MVNTLLGTKQGMTTGYDSRGRRVGATVIALGPNYITQIKKSNGKDGYNAVQLGFGVKKNINKPQLEHMKKAGIEKGVRWLKETRVSGTKGLKVGQVLKIGDILSKGDVVKVSGVSKGRGFQGGVKRYGFAGGPKTHGQSDRHRAPGSIGSGTTPGRVYKGKRMAGHMGVDSVTIKTLEVLEINKSKSLLTVKGGIPGPVGGLVVVQRQGKVKGYTPPPEEKIDDEEEEVGGGSNPSPSEPSESEGVKENAG